MRLMLDLEKRKKYIKGKVYNVDPGCLTEVVNRYRNRLADLEMDYLEVVRQEKEEKFLRMSEAQVSKATKILNPGETAEQQRTWFQTHQERMTEKGKIYRLL